MADETTLRDFSRELGAHDARLDGIEKKVDGLHGKLDDVLAAVQGQREIEAERRGKERLVNGGIALVAGGLFSVLMKKFGA